MAAVNMTRGGVFRHLIRYAVPLILGNLFQLTYNVVDSAIAGRFIGKEALAAEGTANPVMTIVILGISGLCIGSGVLMSEFFGAGDLQKLKREMATSVLFGLYFSLAVTALGMYFAQPLLRLIRVPEALLPMAAAYLRIIFLGTPFTYFYNALSSALKSVGDSKTALRFLMISACLNAVLDLIFIGWLGFGIVCSAVTTVAAEAVSALLAVRHVYRRVPMLRLGRGEWQMDRALLRQTLRYGSVTALQQACQPVGKLLIQGAVNPLGVDVMAVFNAVGRVDDFACMPEQSIAHGITTFVAQNHGAGQPERIRQGVRRGLVLEACYGLAIFLAVYMLRVPLMRIFVSDGDAQALVALGGRYLSMMSLFYLFPAFTNGVQGYFRGMGRMRMTLLCTFIQTAIRVLLTYLLTPALGIDGIALACAGGWSVMLLYEAPQLVRALRRLPQKENDEKNRKFA